MYLSGKLSIPTYCYLNQERNMESNNKEWAEKIKHKADRNFRYKWEVFNDAVQKNLTQNTIWIDCGCGNDKMIEEYAHLAGLALGVDLIKPVNSENRFVKADLRKLPIKNESIDLITLRFVVEHFENKETYLSEFERVLKKQGRIIISTTNLLSPLIQIPRILPIKLKTKILSRLFKISDSDIFPTHHKLNTLGEIKEIGDKFRLIHFEYISDLNYTRKWVFIILLVFHLLTKIKYLNKMRTNIFVILEKISSKV